MLVAMLLSTLSWFMLRTLDANKCRYFISDILSFYSFIETTGDGSHAAQMHCLSIDGACKQELEMPSSAQVTIPFHEKPYLVDQEPQQIASTSDQEVKYADSDLDAPCFSDVEAIVSVFRKSLSSFHNNVKKVMGSRLASHYTLLPLLQQFIEFNLNISDS